ncbi:GntR family transcriptional regulator [Roseinatronobacter alkalisoli]|uniref:GntR family transcriptional regulator n=1 Tax=Roseinatronobacter alkalisoli TaxID=3028235 RepID=A0ABT5T3G7_9RHOB|nr:GntR family transcriptional regulator [Roseinatronobacter sp. HJB301]MDD7969660.1 GntR family transcriptional regulator [Roseinatronobacter sp. HJB301]
MRNRPESASDLSQGQNAYDRLLNEIRHGTLPPGARLREVDLAARLGISRTPVREAIRRLEADGLVEHLPRQGATLRRLSYAEVMELYEMRAVLEGTAARLAARAASELELRELAGINAEMTASTNPEDIVRLNRLFHAALVNTAKNRYLQRAIAAMGRTLLILGRSTLFDPARIATGAQEHEELLRALQNRDGTAAEAAMRTHIEAAHRIRLRQLREAGFLDSHAHEDGGDVPI